MGRHVWVTIKKEHKGGRKDLEEFRQIRETKEGIEYVVYKGRNYVIGQDGCSVGILNEDETCETYDALLFSIQNGKIIGFDYDKTKIPVGDKYTYTVDVKVSDKKWGATHIKTRVYTDDDGLYILRRSEDTFEDYAVRVRYYGGHICEEYLFNPSC